MAVVIFLLAIFLSSLFPKSAFASDNLLSNPDMESWSSDAPDNWSKNYSTLATATLTDSDKVHSGTKAVQLQSSSNSTKYLYQILSVNPNSNYHLSGWTKTISGNGNSYLRASQCSDQDCKNEIKSDDSTHELTTDWKNLTLDFKTSANAVAAKIKTSLDPSSAAGVAIGWDDLSLVSSSPDPPPPTPAPVTSANPQPSPSPQSKPQPSFDFSPPSGVAVGDSFNMPIKISNLDNTSYYIKIRIGPDADHLTHGQTYDSTWLDDNDSWTNFPQIAGPNWSGSVTARLPSDEKDGAYQIAIRVKKATTDSFVESTAQQMQFKPGPPAPSPSPSPPKSPSPPTSKITTVSNIPTQNQEDYTQDLVSSDDQESSIDGEALGISTTSSEQNSSTNASQNKTIDLSAPKKSDNLPPVTDLLIASGLFISGFAAIIFLRTKN